MTQVATWMREEKPSLARMLATCRAAVAGLITNSSAMALLLSPLATRSAISHSRPVSVVSGAAAGLRPVSGDVLGRSSPSSA